MPLREDDGVIGDTRGGIELIETWKPNWANYRLVGPSGTNEPVFLVFIIATGTKKH